MKNIPVITPFLQMIADVPLYIQSFFAKKALYRVSYIQQDIRSIGDKSIVHIGFHPVIFSKGDRLESAFMSDAETIPESNLIKTAIDEDMIYDDDDKILYFLEARLIGKDQTSLLDIRRNEKDKKRKVMAFLADLIRYDGNTIKMGTIQNLSPIYYKSVTKNR